MRTTRSTSLLILTLLGGALSAQTAPCLALNDSNTSIATALTLQSNQGAWQWAYRVTTTKLLLARSLRIFTMSPIRSNFMKLEIWSHDSRTGQPVARLAGGTWLSAQSSKPIWQGANFESILILRANTTFWIVWTEPGYSTPALEPNSSNTLPSVSRAGTGAWSGVSNQPFKFRLFCDLLDDPNTKVFGQACWSKSLITGTAFTNEPPQVGNALFRVECTNMPPGANAFLAMGTDRKYTSISLGNLAPSCYLNNENLVTLSAKTGIGDVRAATAFGHASFALPIPNNPSLKGFFVSFQIAVADSKSTSALPLVFSNGLRSTVF